MFATAARSPRASDSLKPLRDFRKPLRDEVGPVAYTTLQTHGDNRGAGSGCAATETSGYLLKFEPALGGGGPGSIRGRERDTSAYSHHALGRRSHRTRR